MHGDPVNGKRYTDSKIGTKLAKFIPSKNLSESKYFRKNSEKQKYLEIVFLLLDLILKLFLSFYGPWLYKVTHIVMNVQYHPEIPLLSVCRFLNNCLKLHWYWILLWCLCFSSYFRSHDYLKSHTHLWVSDIIDKFPIIHVLIVKKLSKVAFILNSTLMHLLSLSIYVYEMSV